MAARFWTCHWRFQYWSNAVNPEYEPVWYTGSSQFRQRGVRAGDFVYIVSLSGGRLYLGGRMLVDKIVSRDQAVRLTGESHLYDAAWWAMGNASNGTRIDFHRRLAPEISHRLLFVSSEGPAKPLCFVNENDIDGQTTRGIRRLTTESSALLDHLLKVSDSRAPSNRVYTLTESDLAGMLSRE